MDDGDHPHHPWVMAARQGPEGLLCRAGLGLGPKGPNSSRVAKSGPVGFGLRVGDHHPLTRSS